MPGKTNPLAFGAGSTGSVKPPLFVTVERARMEPAVPICTMAELAIELIRKILI